MHRCQRLQQKCDQIIFELTKKTIFRGRMITSISRSSFLSVDLIKTFLKIESCVISHELHMQIKIYSLNGKLL